MDPTHSTSTSSANPVVPAGAPSAPSGRVSQARSVVRLDGSGKQAGKGKAAKKKFPVKDLIKFYRGMASMLRAQINTSDALKYYAHGLPNKDMAETLLKIQESIGAGVTVHEAFRKCERFDSMTVGLLHAGEDSGQLYQAFKALAERMTSDAHFRSKVRKAVGIPSVVIAVLIFAFIMAMTRVVPQVEDMLASVKQKPDPFTGIIFSVSHVTRDIWPVAVLCIIGSIIIIWRSAAVRNFLLNAFMSKWRLLRQLVTGLRQLTFLGTLHMLHSNGINLAKAIRVAAESVRSTPLYGELQVAADRYQHSALPISEAFRKYTSCDAQVGHMLSIGERTASIDSQVELLSQMYEEDTEHYMDDFTQAINLLVLMIAVMLIGTIFVGTFLPIFLMGPKMMKG